MLLVWENFFPIMERKVFYRNKIIKVFIEWDIIIIIIIIIIIKKLQGKVNSLYVYIDSIYHSPLFYNKELQ